MRLVRLGLCAPRNHAPGSLQHSDGSPILYADAGFRKVQRWRTDAKCTLRCNAAEIFTLAANANSRNRVGSIRWRALDWLHFAIRNTWQAALRQGVRPKGEYHLGVLALRHSRYSLLGAQSRR